MHAITQDLPGVEVIADDILVYGCGCGSTKEYLQDHGANLKRLLDWAREQNLKLKIKLKLHLPEVAYMGHLVTREGFRPDPMKVKAIQELPRPEDKKLWKGC